MFIITFIFDGKTKDTTEAREDLQRLHEKDGMTPKQYEGPASYALTKEEKETACLV